MAMLVLLGFAGLAITVLLVANRGRRGRYGYGGSTYDHSSGAWITGAGMSGGDGGGGFFGGGDCGGGGFGGGGGDGGGGGGGC